MQSPGRSKLAEQGGRETSGQISFECAAAAILLSTGPHALNEHVAMLPGLPLWVQDPSEGTCATFLCPLVSYKTGPGCGGVAWPFRIENGKVTRELELIQNLQNPIH